jgi:chromosomal replication initiation ATPase DnaA
MTISAIPLAEYYAKVQATADYLLVNQLARERGYEPDELRGPRRHRWLTAARRAVAEVLRASGWSYPRIGRNLGGRHHTSIMSLVGAANVRSGNRERANLRRRKGT